MPVKVTFHHESTQSKRELIVARVETTDTHLRLVLPDASAEYVPKSDVIGIEDAPRSSQPQPLPFQPRRAGDEESLRYFQLARHATNLAQFLQDAALDSPSAAILTADTLMRDVVALSALLMGMHGASHPADIGDPLAIGEYEGIGEYLAREWSSIQS